MTPVGSLRFRKMNGAFRSSILRRFRANSEHFSSHRGGDPFGSRNLWSNGTNRHHLHKRYLRIDDTWGTNGHLRIIDTYGTNGHHLHSGLTRLHWAAKNLVLCKICIDFGLGREGITLGILTEINVRSGWSINKQRT